MHVLSAQTQQQLPAASLPLTDLMTGPFHMCSFQSQQMTPESSSLAESAAANPYSHGYPSAGPVRSPLRMNTIDVGALMGHRSPCSPQQVRDYPLRWCIAHPSHRKRLHDPCVVKNAGSHAGFFWSHWQHELPAGNVNRQASAGRKLT